MAEVLGGLAGTLQGSVAGLVNKGQGYIDRFFPPEKRAELSAKFSQFVTEKPKLAAFILSQLAVSGIPLGLFIIMTITIALFSIITALLVGLLGALLFIVFCVGVALVILLPTLFFTTMVATFLFVWGLGVYYLWKWFNQDEMSNIKDATGKLLSFGGSGEESENDKLPALNAGGEQGRPMPSKQEGEEGDDKEGGGEKKEHAHAKPQKLQNGSSGKKSGGGGGNPATDAVGKATGVDAGNAVGDVSKKLPVDTGDVTKKANGLKGSVPGGLL